MSAQSRPWMVYGANGYTGRRIVEHALQRDLRPVLAGRREAAVREVADPHGLDVRTFDLSDPARVRAGLEGMGAVLHAAGPFSETAAPMQEACMDVGVHYVDITGEIEVFVETHARGRRAEEAGVVLLPGAGFDVVPTDCLAAHLAARLPDATHLTLAFTGESGVSRGTARTALRGLAEGGCVRRDGEIVRVPLGDQVREVPFPHRTETALQIPWGDVATAYHSTGIPNVEVYVGMPRSQARWVRRTRWLHGLASWQLVQGLLDRWIDASVEGPSPELRARARSFVWGEVRNPDGERRAATLTCHEGYRFTAEASVEITLRLLEGAVAPGSKTPSLAFGPDLVLDLPGTERVDLPEETSEGS